MLIIYLDYSEIERRAAALEALEMPPKYDVHIARACHEFGVDASQVTPTMRNRAKELNYFELYGNHACKLI